ncbi:hypothetical protein GCM10009657_38520 [Oryzihumus leptocrescens]
MNMNAISRIGRAKMSRLPRPAPEEAAAGASDDMSQSFTTVGLTRTTGDNVPGRAEVPDGAGAFA